MQIDENKVIDSALVNDTYTVRRRELLPWWIKVFVWIFLIFGAVAPIGLIFGLLGYQFQLALYGFETLTPMSLTGIGIAFLFILKGIAALGLWTEKDWAISISQIDAILGIIICVLSMAVIPFIGSGSGFNLTFRLELILLIPFLIKLGRIKNEWMNSSFK